MAFQQPALTLPVCQDLQGFSINSSEKIVAPEIDLFWKLVAESGLLGDDQYRTARDECQSGDSTAAADWLIKNKLIAPLHRTVLLRGHAGPFFYGRYVVTSRLKLPQEPQGFESFAATDRKTGYPVRLQFFDGLAPDALKTWASIDNHVRAKAKLLNAAAPQSCALEIYQAISLTDTRFVVRELPRGKTLDDAVPLKSRLGVSQAIKIVAQASTMLADGRDRLPIPLDPRSLMKRLWIGSGKVVRFDPLVPHDQSTLDEMTTDQPHHQGFLLGVLLLRLVSGRPLPLKWDKKDDWFRFDEKRRNTLMSKFDDLVELQTLLSDAISRDPRSAIGVKEFDARLCKKLDVEPDEIQSTDQRVAFLNSLGNLELLVGKTSAVTPEFIPEIDIDADLSSTIDSLASGSDADDARVLSARAATVKRKQSRLIGPIAVAAGLLLMGTLCGGWMLWAGGKSVPLVQLKANRSQPQATILETPEPREKVVPAIDFTSVSYVQTLVDDGEATLWESPTTGLALDFSWLPARTEIVFHLRGKDLLAQPGGQNLLRSLGPDFWKFRDAFEFRAGVPISQMDSLTVAMVPEEFGGYTPFFQISASNMTEEQLVAAWGNPDDVLLPSKRKLFAADDIAWSFVDTPVPVSDSADGALQFVFGQPRLVQQVLQDGATVVWPDPMERLISKTDRLRHFTMVTMANALVNQNSKRLWGRWSDRLLPALRLALPDEIRAFSVGLHVDDGEYVELHVDHSAGISSRDLAIELRRSTCETFSKVGEFSRSLARTKHWQQLQDRFGVMLETLNAAMRWETEFDHVIGNAWLPPNASHNLLSAAELTMTFSESVAETQRIELPSSIEELLATKRSLNVTNPPDLNVLLSDIRAEIMDDYPGLNFPFQIKLIGVDLQKEGITQNQRPGPLAMVDQPLSEILTRIMTSANPDKSISGPADPNCKLVWVVAEYPDDQANKAVLITTRAAAEEKGYSLPGVFVEK